MDTIKNIENVISTRCLICKKVFIRGLEHKKYCSIECSKTARRMRMRKSSKKRYHDKKLEYKRCKWCNSEAHIDNRHDHNCCNKEECIEQHKKWKRKVTNRKSYLKTRGKTDKQKKLDAETSKRYRNNHREELRIKDKWRKQKKRAWIENFKKQQSCKKCNDNRFYCLDLHHLDPNEKEYKISEMVWQGFSINKIKTELEKCEPLCSNCHREFHYQDKTMGIDFNEWINE